MDRLGSFVRQIQPKYDDDAIDRLNYYYSVFIILAFAITIGAKQYAGEPIQCWVPAEFTGPWEQYAENYCFVENTYFVPLNQSIPDDIGVRKKREIAYYQWVPFVLALQALLFYVPHWIWSLLNWQSGLNLHELTNMASDAKNISPDDRRKNVATISSHLYNSTTFQKRIGRMNNPIMWLLKCGKPKGAFISVLYLIVKLLYIINIIGQLAILDDFLDPSSRLWSARILSRLRQGEDWQYNGHFPRTTFCDFETKWLGNVQRRTIQCVLMINMFNEKIYIFLWFWFIFVAICTVFNTFYWFHLILSNVSRINFVKKYYKVARAKTAPMTEKTTGPRMNDAERLSVERFVRSKLRPDGVFVLRMLASNAGDLLTTEVIEDLYGRVVILVLGKRPRMAILVLVLGQKPRTDNTSSGIVDRLFAFGASTMTCVVQSWMHFSATNQSHN